ncbi:MAG: DUF2244 domain-containing protein [Gammaproteobacteria bacterium]|jgi:uncharacterized membrane protein
MVEAQINPHEQGGHIVLSPNRSVRWSDNVLFLYIVCGLAVLIGISFSMLGMWLVLPFTGLEVIALIAVVYYVAHKCRRIEVIRVEDGCVQVEQGVTQPQTSWRSDLFWTRLIVMPRERPWHPLHIYLRGRHDQIEIGTFLNEDDKQILIKQIRQFVTSV